MNRVEHDNTRLASVTQAIWALVDKLAPRRIYMTASSSDEPGSFDWDFFIVLDNDASRRLWDGTFAENVLSGLGIRSQVTVAGVDDFRSALQVPHSLAAQVVEEGHLVFASRQHQHQEPPAHRLSA
ncbi:MULTISPECIES: hypothetical protein [Azospirillaceae]|uniref:Polymerase beta nucleotidyltransferase domain-containing protein n=1 Tax=Nitrospirillum viridazoti CBAmc TaxID=1441467 RepID=A0A248JU50_9PROT|nr:MULTISPECIES: hypothetical protein [Azospirillaceae]ASG22247.1 hypothetical protein Y958_14890 [Nitrospirillum amazonense CBAmc]TWB30987.1 hypothetical protein FBZ91_12128 [Nitrospirillum amazonense]